MIIGIIASRPEPPARNKGGCELSKKSRQGQRSVCLVCLDTNKGRQCLISGQMENWEIKRAGLCEAFCDEQASKTIMSGCPGIGCGEDGRRMDDEPKRGRNAATG